MDESGLIKTGFCVAYDWALLLNSLPPVYQSSDKICLALDRNNISWAGNTYDFDKDKFEAMVKEIDVDGKVDIYYDDFYQEGLNARENCNRHRTMIADRMGLTGGWYVQVDVDEYFVDFDGFAKYLKGISTNPTLKDKPVNIQVAQFPIIKKIDGGFLYVEFGEREPNYGPFATNHPEYLRARVNGHFNVYSPFYVVHETWSRGAEELEFKLKNWGHSAEELSDFSIIDSYVNLWKSLDKNTYQFVRDFHFTIPKAWPRLEFAEGDTVQELLQHFKPDHKPNKLKLKVTNTRLYGKIKQIMKS